MSASVIKILQDVLWGTLTTHSWNGHYEYSKDVSKEQPDSNTELDIHERS